MNTFLSGKRVSLGRLEPDDYFIDIMAQWLDDRKVTELLFAGLLPADPEAIRQEWRRSLQDPNEIVFQVRGGGVFIGTAGLYAINWVARTAEYRIFLGSRKHWGQGLGAETTKCILRYAFEKINLHSVWLGVNTENRAAVRLYERVGFVHEGILRQIYYRNGRYYDIKRMSLLKEEFDEL